MSLICYNLFKQQQLRMLVRHGGVMAKFILLGKYSAQSVNEISANRTDKAIHFIAQLGGKILDMYALLGGYDCVMILELNSMETAMKASLGLTTLTGISFNTYPAIAVNDFDKMLG